jgi:hypothetical protein
MAALAGVSLSGAGWLLPFHIGAVSALRHAKLISPRTLLCGASGGSLVAAAAALDVPLERILHTQETLAEAALKSGAWRRGGIRQLMEEPLRRLLPKNACARLKELEALHGGCPRLAVAVLPMPVRPWSKPVLLTHFKDDEDLVQALLASCHVPFYMDGKATCALRGRRAVDGGLVDLVPPVHGALGISPFPALMLKILRQRAEVVVDGGARKLLPNSLRLVTAALWPPSYAETEHLYHAGEVAATEVAQKLRRAWPPHLLRDTDENATERMLADVRQWPDDEDEEAGVGR